VVHNGIIENFAALRREIAGHRDLPVRRDHGHAYGGAARPRAARRVLGICNVNGSSIPRECDAVLYTHAGPEIAVASTKAFLTQLLAWGGRT
jgi:glucosamine 6-phosphate synthetase-like amidotransferase/phosphosugar isomerase protein